MKKIAPSHPYVKKYDLSNCENEPIHIIQTVQSFAAIIAIDISDLIIRQVSSNLYSYLCLTPDKVINQSIYSLFSSDTIKALKKGIALNDFSDINPIRLPILVDLMEERILIAHLVDANQLVLEIEFSDEKKHNIAYLNKIEKGILKIQTASFSDRLLDEVAQQIKAITNYDRVMIYKFDKSYNGAVVAEALESNLEPFLGLNYPASDIPKQARDLFLKNNIRMIIDVDDELSYITPSLSSTTNEPLNVGNCAARGVSPIHIEYLKNMGVKASLSISIVEDGKLWGLISCHHYREKKIISFDTRNFIRFIGQIISGHLSIYRLAQYKESALQQNITRIRLQEQMNDKLDIVLGLTEEELTLMHYIDSAGVAILFEGNFKAIGDTPSESEITQITDFLNTNTEDKIFQTHTLRKALPDEADFTKKFAGLLAVKLSKNPNEYILWFRYAREKEVLWGGNPNKAVIKKEEGMRMSPRKSFEKWKQVVSNESKEWGKSDIDAAITLLNDIKEITLKRLGEIKKLHQELKVSYQELEQFSYTVSHDLRSPLRAIEAYVRILLEDYAQKIDDEGKEIMQTILSSTDKVNEFIKGLLEVSKTSASQLRYNEIDVNQLLPQLLDIIVKSDKAYEKVQITVQENLPKIAGDHIMLKQLFQNLLSNSIKYSILEDQPQVEVGAVEKEGATYFYIKDNGIGMEEKNIPKIFQLFKRLVPEEKFEGTGIGLAIVKKIIDKHQGKINVETAYGKGTTFWFTIPEQKKND